MKKCVIVGGAGIDNYYRIADYLSDDDYFVYCDSGLRHPDALGYEPDLLIGDWDSHENPHLDAETITLPHIKDDTDSFFAVKECVKRGFEEFILIGMLGGRFDHSLGNLSALLYLKEQGKKAVMLDDFSEIAVIEAGETAYVDGSFSYFSLINLTGDAHGFTIRNALYPLDKAEISWDWQYAVSNEVLPGETAEISLESGRALLFKVY